MLLSDKSTARYIAQNFVPTWRMIRPVPKVTIDFGNGKKLDRTLVGNTVLYFARPDGRVLDAIPGVCTPAKWLPVAQASITRFHAGEQSLALRGVDSIAVARSIPFNAGKSAVESPILRTGTVATSAAATGPSATGRPSMNMSKMSMQSPVLRAGGMPPRLGANASNRANAKPLWQIHADQLEDVSKQPRSPDEVGRSIGSSSIASRLEAESMRNVDYVRPVIQEFLASKRWALRYDQASPTIFKQILHLDIDDPYLGLANFGAPGTPMPKR